MIGVYVIFVITQLLNTLITYKVVKKSILKNIHRYAEEKTRAENYRLKEEKKLLLERLRKRNNEMRADKSVVRSALNILNGYKTKQDNIPEVKK
jgi:uncharacterized membrane protein (DUF106 family)